MAKLSVIAREAKRQKLVATHVAKRKALKEAGANRVFGACTHAVLSANAIERIEDSPLKYLLVTDSIPMKRSSNKIVVKSVAKLFAEAIRRTNSDKSISSLFDENGKKK